MNRSLVVNALVLAIFLVSTRTVAGQQVEPRIAWSTTSELPSRVVAGVVLEASTGRLLRYAHVQVLGTDIAALSDMMGRFRLAPLPAGRYELRVQMIGYAPMKGSIDVQDGRGVAVRATIAEQALPLCGLVVCGGFCGAVRVDVRDVLTGAGPRVGVVLRVEQDSGVDSDFGEPAPGRSSVSLSAGRGNGPFDVEVAAPGYETWRRSDVRIERGACGAVKSAPLQVWLLPEG